MRAPKAMERQAAQPQEAHRERHGVVMSAKVSATALVGKAGVFAIRLSLTRAIYLSLGCSNKLCLGYWTVHEYSMSGRLQAAVVRHQSYRPASSAAQYCETHADVHLARQRHVEACSMWK